MVRAMNIRLFLWLPLCGVPAWFAGRRMAEWAGAETRAAAAPVEIWNSNAAPAARAMWEELCEKEPTVAHRWQALELFERWAAEDPRAAAERLVALPEDGCRLWPGRGALEAFFKMWAARDPEAAWRAVQEEQFNAARNTVAGLRAETHPEEIGLDESLDKGVRHLARMRLAAKDPAAAMKLDWIRNDTMVAALMAARDPVACWREICAGGTTYRVDQAIGRLSIHSRGAALALMEEVLKDASTHEDYTTKATLETLIFTAASPEELKSVPRLEDNTSYEWHNAMRAWDDSTLRDVLEHPPGSGEEAKDDRSIFAVAMSELMARDPMALLPYLQRWGAEQPAAGGLSLPHEDRTPERAAQLRALIEAAPEPWGQRLAAANSEVLEQCEPAFLLARVEAQNAIAAEGERIATEGVLRRWLEQDSAAATAWMQAHPLAVTDAEVEAVAQKWTGHDPESSSAWINTLPAGAQRDAAIRGLVGKMTPHDPAAAGAWAARISDTAERARMQEEVLTVWRMWEPNAQLPP
jgi:hypothetical protein